MPGASFSLHESDCRYEICSAAGSDETADNLPGPGRLLGNFYSLVGRKLEAELGHTAQRLGFGPQAVAKKIQKIKIEDSDGYVWLSKRKKAEKMCKHLVRHVK